MKNYAKVGNKKGKPAYRTPATFIYRKHVRLRSIKNKQSFSAKGGATSDEKKYS